MLVVQDVGAFLSRTAPARARAIAGAEVVDLEQLGHVRDRGGATSDQRMVAGLRSVARGENRAVASHVGDGEGYRGGRDGGRGGLAAEGGEDQVGGKFFHTR